VGCRPDARPRSGARPCARPTEAASGWPSCRRTGRGAALRSFASREAAPAQRIRPKASAARPLAPQRGRSAARSARGSGRRTRSRPRLAKQRKFHNARLWIAAHRGAASAAPARVSINAVMKRSATGADTQAAPAREQTRGGCRPIAWLRSMRSRPKGCGAKRAM